MLTPQNLLVGYARGIFPMAADAGDDQLFWFEPDPRGILPLGGVHASRSLIRELRRGDWSARHAPDFDAVVARCAARPETWINRPLRRLYRQLHDHGHAHALEVWRNGQLAGGIFGVVLGGAYFGESMFSTLPSGSRMALLWMDMHLRGCGFSLFDTQYLTPHLASMGGVEIPRARYRLLLAEALTRDADIRRPLPDRQALLQEITQTS